MRYRKLIALFGGDEVDSWEPPKVSSWYPCKESHLAPVWSKEFCDKYNISNPGETFDFRKICTKNHELTPEILMRENHLRPIIPGRDWDVWVNEDTKTCITINPGVDEKYIPKAQDYIDANPGFRTNIKLGDL